MIEDPCDSSRSIGVVGFDYTIAGNENRDIPQDYIYRKVRALRSELLSRYPGVLRPLHSGLQDKIVIVVSDVVQTSDEIVGLLEAIRRHQPKRIVVTAPAITHCAARTVAKHAEVSIFIHFTSEDMINRIYMNLNSISDKAAIELLNVSGSATSQSEWIKSNFNVDNAGTISPASVASERRKIRLQDLSRKRLNQPDQKVILTTYT
ncbi:MAG TPA: hypothetical protein VFW11_10650 [Cyclobacteriaceae bacterium]|nr:hypothetical protein [Cyclobacteriaceae bacterium]